MKEEKQETPKMAHPYQAIPMPYSPLSQKKETSNISDISSSSGNKKSTSKKKKKKTKEEVQEVVEEQNSNPKALLCKSKTETMPIWQQPDKADSLSWNMHLKTLLYEKACLVYVTLAESDYMAENYGEFVVLQVLTS